MIRVLHFFKTYYPDTMGGIEQVIFQLCRNSENHGVKNSVLSLSRNADDRTLQIGGHEVHRAKMDFQFASTGFSVSAFRMFSRLAEEADIVHYHFPWPFMDLVHFLSGHGKPTVLSYHADIVRQKALLKLYRPLKHRFLSNVDRIVASSPNYLESSPVLRRYQQKVEVIPYGLDSSSYPPPEPDVVDKWRTRFEGRFFLFVGMIRYYKGLHILLEAIRGTDYPVVIVGSGPLENELREKVARLGLKSVHFCGALPDEDKIALLQLCYAVIFPSHLRAESFGISLLEGAMFGKPLISCEIGTGTSYINLNEDTGLVVSPNNPKALQGGMRYLWENPGIASEMGRRARARYLEFFTSDKMVSGYTKLYKTLLNRG